MNATDRVVLGGALPASSVQSAIRPLFVAYYFPPIGGAGAQRPANFARHLHELGFAPAILTGPGLPTGRWTPLDETLGASMPEGIEIVRADDEPPTDLRWRNRAQ